MIHTTIKLVLIILLSLGTMICVTGEVTVDELQMFLDNDNTGESEYVLWYNCGHAARDLARNASEHNLTIGSAIVSNHPVFSGKWNSHIINYIYIDGEILFIDTHHNSISSLEGIFFDWEYIRLYPDGTQVPSNWVNNLAPTISFDDYVLS